MIRHAAFGTLIKKLGTITLLIGSMLLSFPAHSQMTNTQGTAQITSVVPISPKAWQTIVIKGSNFGRNAPINGCPDHLRVTDVTTNWSVPAVGPFGGCQAGIFISSWNDNEIVIEGFPSFQRGQDAFKIGDVIKIEVSNAQQGGPASWYSVRVSPEAAQSLASTAAAPVSTQSSQPTAPGAAQIVSVSPISPKGWQTIVIKGSNFGRNAPINGCPDHLRVTDVTTNWSVPAVGPFGGCQAGIFISSWNDNEIVIEGFPSFQRGQDAFKIGDVIKIEVSNAQQGGPASWYSVRVAPQAILAPAPPPPAPVSTQGSQPAAAPTLPVGTSIMVRMIDSVDSSKNKVGDAFHASLDRELVIGDTVVAPKGADVYGKLAQAKSAGKISGGAELTLEMTGIQISGNIVPVDTTDYEAVSKGRGKQSAARIGGGAALGSIIGGIARGGKGAAIGAAAGAGAGTAVQLATHGQHIYIPSETLLEFKLQSAVQVATPSAEPQPTSPLAPTPTVELQPGQASVSLSQVPISESAGAKSSFTSDTALDPAHWQTGTALLARLAQAEGTRWVQSQLSFGQPGMKISGVNGEYQFTGVQSEASFAVPFSVRTTVMGIIANGNPFSFYIVSDDLRQSLRIDGNLNPNNGEYYGLGIRVGNSQGFKMLQNVGVGQWYTLVVALDANGVGTVTIEDSKGTILATKTDLPVGLGPFFMVLGQREGAPFTVGPNQAVWSSVELIPGAAATPSSSASAPSIVQATIRAGGTSLELPPGQMYLYGMSTGGGAPSSQFTAGQYADAVNAAGQLSDALAYGTNGQNSYTTQTAYHDIGGVSVAGSWEHFAAYYGSNHQSGAHDASVSFQANEDSLVVVLGLASSQQFVSVEGIPNLEVDASRTGGGMVIAHAYVKPGTYNVIEHSKVLAAGQDPSHMTDLVGVFVFGGGQVNKPEGKGTGNPSISSVTPITPQATQSIVIRGSGFGSLSPYDGDSEFIMIGDVTKDWRAGCKGRPECGPGANRITLRVGLWTDGEIHVEGFGSRYGALPSLRLNPGDEVKLWAWNAQTGSGPATYLTTVSSTSSVGPDSARPAPAPPNGAPSGRSAIRSVDFQSFSYESNCSEKVDPGFGKIIPATNGSWKKGSLESGDSLSFRVVKVSYGDVKGDGQVEAIVHTACQPPANWDYEELSVFQMSGEAPTLLARLTPGEGLADHGPRYDVVKADGGELSVSYQVTGEHGSGACPEWTVTERFRWNGSRFVSTGQSRRKNSCAQ